MGPQHQQKGKKSNDHSGRPVEGNGTEMDAGRNAPSHEFGEIGQIYTPVLGNHSPGHHHFKDHIPADYPCNELAYCGIGEGIR